MPDELVRGPAVIETKTGDRFLVAHVRVAPLWAPDDAWLLADVDGDREIQWLLKDATPKTSGDTLTFRTADHGDVTCRPLVLADRDWFFVDTPDTLAAFRAFAAEGLGLT